MEDTLYVIWGDADNTGIPIIDEQRRGLVSVINTLSFFIGRDKGGEMLKTVMKAVEQSAMMHFATEEALMEECGYPQREQHYRFHKHLLESARYILYEEATDEDAVQALRFLRKWWRYHSMDADNEFAAFYLNYLEKK